MAAIGRLALVLGLLLLQPLASESGPDPIGCGSNEAKAVWPGGYAEWNFTPPPGAEVVLATCDTGGDTVLVIDGIEHDDDGICGAARRNERVVVPAGWESKGSVAIRVRFYDPAVEGLLQLGVTCYNTSPPTLSPAAAVSPTPPTPPLTPAPTTTAPTTSGATFAPTAAPTGEDPTPACPTALSLPILTHTIDLASHQPTNQHPTHHTPPDATTKPPPVAPAPPLKN